MCWLVPPACEPQQLIFQTPPPQPPPSPPPPTPPPPIHRKSHSLSLALTISLSILAAIFLVFICCTIYKFCSSWYRSRRRPSPPPEEDGGRDDFLDEEHGPVVDHPIWYIRTIGLQPSVISAITIVKYKRGEGLIEGSDCSVCLNEFEEDETLRLLPKCNHAFHIPCIDTWLRAHTNCPMCRAGIVTNVAAPLPLQELVIQNSGPVEENQSEISGSSTEFGRDYENSSESMPGIEDDGISRSPSGLKIDEDTCVSDGILPMRRSVSVDSSSASMIRTAIANAFPGQFVGSSDNQWVEMKEPTVERPSQTAGTSSIKRSVSCSAKVFLSRHGSRSRNSQ